YKKAAAQTNGDLIIDNNDQDNADDTYMGKSPLLAGDWIFDNLTISGAGKLDANGYNLTINADFKNTGTFIHSSRTVTFADNTQVSHIYGDTTFNKFTCVTAGKAFQFEATKTQTIAGTLTLTGQSGSLISLRSTSDGTQWKIDPQGTRDVNYVDVKDSNNINTTAIAAFLSLDSLNNTNWNCFSFGVAEFVSIIDPDDGAGTDYTSLSSWESNNQADLSVATTLVFSHAGITGAIVDTDSVTGATSGATADVIHASSTQILLENISGVFVSGEQVYQTQDTNYVTISNTGDLAISVASCRSSAGTADTTAVIIDGWTTLETNYIKIYTETENRHSGIWSDSVYRLSLTAGANDTHLLDIKENHVKVEGLQISLTNAGGYTGCKAVNIDSQVAPSGISLNSNILKGIISETNSQGMGIYANDADITAKIYNNIIYDFVNGAAANTAGITTATGGIYYLYNNTLIDNYLGINIGAGTAAAKNNIVKGSGNTNAYTGTFAAGTDYNATDGTDDIGPGSNNQTTQTFFFVNESGDDFHLSSADSGAKDSGADLSNDSNISISDDIDGETRLGAWDIGADMAGDVIWDGSESSDWLVGANWTGGAAPTSDSDVIINGNYTNAPTLDLISGLTTINSLSLGDNNASVLTLSNGNSSTNKLIVTGDVNVGVNGTLTHTANTTAQTHIVNLEAANLIVQGAINLNSKGYQYSEGPGQGVGTDFGGGAGHGGDGGDGVNAIGGSSYGSITQPITIGSGGCFHSGTGGSGGGAVKLTVSGTTSLSGSITANGQTASNYTGGGSGGSVYITTGTLSGNGSLSVNGGNGSGTNYGGGGGGRIAVYYTTDSSTVSYQAYGPGPSGRYGGAGTIYTKVEVQTNGDLIVNNNSNSGASTPLLTSDWTFDNLTISGAGKLDANGCNLTINADFNNAGTFTHSSRTVTFADNTQVSHIYGDTTFNKFTCVTAGKELQFEATKTQTIAGSININRPVRKPYHPKKHIRRHSMEYRPSSATRNVSYVDVKDSNNVNITEIRAFYPVDSLNNINWDWMSVGLAEFVSIVDPDDGAGTDYISLFSWESNNQADLTVDTTLVFSHAGITGTISDTDSVTGLTSGAAADVVHATSTQILLENISGVFEAEEQVYVTQDTNYVTISNSGDMAIAVASCRSSSGTADTTAVSIDGWTTSATNYIKIYTTAENRHSGIWSDSVYRLSLTAGANDTQMLDIKENYVKVEGLQISLTNSGGHTGCKAVNMDSQVAPSEISLNSNILKGIISETNSEATGVYANGADTMAKIYNNIIYDFVNGAAANTAGITTATGGTYYLYNNSLIDNYLGINIGAGTAAAKNNIVKGSGDTNAYTGTFAVGTDYNATDGTDDIGQGSNNKTEQIFSFVNEAIDDFHLSSTDLAARDSGTDLSGDADLSVSDDIDGDTRLGIWDIGADAVGDVIWDGSESTDWAVGANWLGGLAPTLADTVIIDGNYTNAPTLDLTSGTTTIKRFSLGENNASVLTLSNGNATTNKLVVTGDVNIGANGTLTQTANTTAETHIINLGAANFTIASGGAVNVNEKGYQGGSGTGSGGNVGTSGAGGASYAGVGGVGVSGGAGATYGSITEPINIGSGGGNNSYGSGGAGGGAVKLTVSGTTTINGNIYSDGGDYTNDSLGGQGGGSGGSIYISTETLFGAGTIFANGGNGGSGAGGGGGGRIAVYYTTDSSTVSYQAYGGKNSTATSRMGGAGTIYKKAAAQTNGDLIIDNNDQD
ncbi:MAG: hypothetical protein KAI72_06300, partial [Candidatus Pacebacteria bacterium]|nr:hypothetical protein [Candidatus Paceibacterota bacterium]